jgi:hypothetical protein
MKLTITLLLLSVVIPMAQNVKAQATFKDSASITRTAKVNARTFRLSRELQLKFKENNFPSSSDYFKPTIAYTSDVDLLKDSLYVQSFRYAAFYNTVKGRIRPTFRDLLIPHLPSRQLVIQPMEPEYTAGVAEIAQRDANKFRLTASEMEKFKTEHLPNTSDYFKPNSNYTSDPPLLNDSVYTKAFRQSAFYQALTQKDHSPKITILLVGAGTVAAGLLILAISALAGNSN